MSSRLKKRTATILVFAVLMLNGLFSIQVAAHTLEHLQHTPSTEASQGCSWACSAGEIVDSPAQPFNHHGQLTRFAEGLNPSIPFIISSNLPVSRAPPKAFA